VHVTRITIPGTVEDRILELQDRKRQLVADVLGGGAGDRGGATNRLSMQELQYLFYGSG
jgi:SNF2 family DNA or RNA helicase